MSDIRSDRRWPCTDVGGRFLQLKADVIAARTPMIGPNRGSGQTARRVPDPCQSSRSPTGVAGTTGNRTRSDQINGVQLSQDR